MEKFTSQRDINRLTALLALTYMVSYLTRINFGAVVSEMTIATGIPRRLLSLSLTGSFVTYGIGQIFSGVLGDRISPKKLVGLGLVLTVAMNALLPFCGSPWAMMAVWCINGLAQAMLWPPIVRIMSALLSAGEYNRSVTKVSWGSSFGTILIYLLSPLIILWVGWKGVFLFCAGSGLLMIFLWMTKAPDLPAPGTGARAAAGKSSSAVLFSPLMLLLMVAIVLQGMLRDGITTWMPSFVSESFQLGSAVSILTGVLLPVFSIVCNTLTARIHETKIRNPITCSGLLFGAGAAFALALYLSFGRNAAGSVFLCAALTGSMHGVNLLLICMVPRYFERYGNVSTASGVLNACTYVGSALSTYGIAALSETAGWKPTILLWSLIALIGFILCMALIRPWNKQFPIEKE